MSCASTLSQYGAVAALEGPQDSVGEMVQSYRDRRDAVIEELELRGVGYVRPTGAFFLMADVSATGMPSWEASAELLREEHVAVVPGAAFGPGGEGFVRLSLAAADEVVGEGARRFARFVDRHRR